MIKDQDDLIYRQISHLPLLCNHLAQHVVIADETLPIVKPAPTYTVELVIEHQPLGLIHHLEKCGHC